MANRPTIRLPRQWPRHVKSGILHAISLASVVMAVARSRAVGRKRLHAQLDQATAEIALLQEELLIKDGRWERSQSRRRPHYSPVQRMQILQLRSARGWTLEKTAQLFLVDLQTLLHWMRRLDEPGERPLIQTVEPVNRYPDFVRNLVRQLKCLLPTMGYERMAQVLARAGLALGATTISRWLSGVVVVSSPSTLGMFGTSISRRCLLVLDSGYPGSLFRCRNGGRSVGGLPWQSISSPEPLSASPSLPSCQRPSKSRLSWTEPSGPADPHPSTSSPIKASSSGAVASRTGASVEESGRATERSVSPRASPLSSDSSDR